MSVFPSIDTKSIAGSLKLEEQGRTRGRQNQPPADASGHDHIETAIIERIEELRRKGLENYENNRRVYNERLARAGQASKEVDIAAGAARNDFGALVQVWRSRIVAVRERLNESYNWRNRYRQIHRLERPAHEFGGWTNVIALALILITLEAGMNSYLFSKGNEFGLLGGLLVAVIVSLVNVGASILLGYLARYLNHRNLILKLLGLAALAGWLGFAVAINLAVAHFRDGLEQGLEWAVAAQQAVPALIARPVALASIESWLLVGLGALISTLAFRKGWHTDDPYPGYGPVERRLEQARLRYEEDLHSALDELQKRRDDAIEELQDANEQVRDGITEAVDSLFGQSSLGAHLRSFLDQCDLKAAHLLATYRDANLAERTAPAPASFQQPYAFPPFEPEAVDASRRQAAEVEAARVKATVETAISEIFEQFEQARQVFNVTDDVELDGPKPGRSPRSGA
ncbi:MAG: hypothetical protein QM682_09635 [Paracoccus sp. (in: a-proteobacteria)]|uniref:hypothetical protein n=1 Tax=Paracoccus sp. TaxID=267 RepID=UPI0039E5D1CA